MNKYIHWFSVDAIPIRVKKKFSKMSGLVWTGPYSDTVILDDSKFSAQSCFRNDVFYCSKQYRNNVATLCCAKSGRCESFRVISTRTKHNIHGQHPFWITAQLRAIFRRERSDDPSATFYPGFYEGHERTG